MPETTPPDSRDIADFICRWGASAAAERANYALFLTQLCDLLGVPQPEPTTDDVEKNAYVFERDVTFQEADGSTSIGRIDLYKRACFVLEAKQGSDAEQSDEAALLHQPEASARARTTPRRKRGTAVRGTPAWDDAMIRARGQADRYARALPGSEGWPAFLIVVDVGHVIELYSEFTRQGKTYVPFPDPQSFRIKLADLENPAIRERLKLVWTDPLALDPSKKSAKVTRDLASRLAELAKLLEKAGHEPAKVARFLMRCLFTMFAEDVELIPKDAFKKLLSELEGNPAAFPPMIESLWQTMNAGGFSTILRQTVLRFNGGLFAEHEALPLTAAMLKLLRQASEAFWGDVEPAIFGTLLERALDPVERHKLGAHYTPRAYVERLVLPTIIEPLRDEWNTTYATALAQARTGKVEAAHTLIRQFHEKLCETRVLDPACGSGNFLYVTLEQMKRLEGEVLNALRELGYQQKILLEIDPHQFLGIEINPRAAAIADLVLWIGYLQWHFRTRGKATPAEPIIKDYDNIECRDAVLAWDRTEPLLDEAGQPVTRWDGRTTKRHPVTGEEVPDETARVEVLKYINPRKAEWPKADYVVGNPPFLGQQRMRRELGDGYVDAIRASHPDVNESADYVMLWWDNAATLVGEKWVRRAGLITTNSVTQQMNRLVVAHRLESGKMSISFAVPDHPWVTSEDGAAVRVSMTVTAQGQADGTLLTIYSEVARSDAYEVALEPRLGRINANLSVGADVTECKGLIANSSIAIKGFELGSQGFLVPTDEAMALLRDNSPMNGVLKPYMNGSDLVDGKVRRYVIDFNGLTEHECRSFPSLYQRVVDNVKPERAVNRESRTAKTWWLWRRAGTELRKAAATTLRFIAITRTAKHFVFQFVPNNTVVETTIVAIVLEDPFFLGILSSSIHVKWAKRTGGTLEDRPRYQHQLTFEPFPFPECHPALIDEIRQLAEQLDAHRKRQQALHPWLTLTDMYNVLEKLRAGENLKEKDQKIHEAGLVSVLKQIHDDLDAAVFAAYGWPATLSDEQILERLVALNAERAAEEARGLVRWLRPEFQCRPARPSLAGDGEEVESPVQSKRRSKSVPPPSAQGPGRTTLPAAKQPWPAEQAARTKAVQEALAAAGEATTAADLAKRFQRARASTVEEILDALVSLGLAHKQRGGKFSV